MNSVGCGAAISSRGQRGSHVPIAERGEATPAVKQERKGWHRAAVLPAERTAPVFPSVSPCLNVPPPSPHPRLLVLVPCFWKRIGFIGSGRPCAEERWPLTLQLAADSGVSAEVVPEVLAGGDVHSPALLGCVQSSHSMCLSGAGMRGWS